MATRSQTAFQTVKSEGALLPADLLKRVADGDRGLDGLTPESYHLDPSERINEATNHAWVASREAWQRFAKQRTELPESDKGTTLTRERWLLVLFRELGYSRLQAQPPIEMDGRSYAISHAWGHAPIHLVSFRYDLDKSVPGVARVSPHSLVQDVLNRSDNRLWAFVSNGLVVRILRDNISFTRPAYVEFDLEAIFAGEVYSDFVLLWLLCHQSRVESDRPEQCWLEKWHQAAKQQGTRALDRLRDGVQNAIEAFGQGFLAHRANAGLRQKLADGTLTTQEYYQQVLRLVYRLIFLFVAEDRDLLLSRDADPAARRRYEQHYALSRIRRLAERRRGTRHADLWQVVQLVFRHLYRGEPRLALPALGSMLFSDRTMPDLDDCELANDALLTAVRHLAFTQDRNVLRAVDFKNLGSEELGSVYESLLELHPDINAAAATFTLASVAGSERKTTGSYYTPTSLINCLLDSALHPVVDERLKGKSGADADRALLSLKVCDPACGSGHFLIAAANRLAHRLARVRTGDDEPSPTARRAAFRDVVSRCIYGVDINPMAVELCKVALWLESIDPGRPLSFLDHRILCGNSLLGVTPRLLKEGIPDAAFEPIEGDDKAVCRELKRRNKDERKGQGQLWDAAGRPSERFGDLAAAMAALDSVADDTLAGVQDKQRRWQEFVQSSGYLSGRLLADAWCAAFVWNKTREFGDVITESVFRRIERNPHDLTPRMRDEIKRLADQYKFFHWHLAFPEIFRLAAPHESEHNGQTGCSGGFDVILGNPPWVSYTGRQQAHVPEGTIRLLLARFPCVARWPATHPAFLVLSAQLVAEGGRTGLVLPKQVADLSAYGPTRAAVTDVAQLAAPVVDAGEHAFPCVTQPVGLFSIIATPTGATGSPTPWPLGGSEAHGTAAIRVSGAQATGLNIIRDVVALLANKRRFEPKTFADPGVHTGNVSKKIIVHVTPPGAPGYEPIREGRDIAAFICAAPKKWLWTAPELEEGEYCTIRNAERYRGVPILIRQTADRPIAARHRDPTYFRNSLLACFGVPGVPDAIVVAFLNSALYALLHRALTQDANQKAFPQVKVRHLHALPAIPTDHLDRDYAGQSLRDALNAAVLESEAAARLNLPPPRDLRERIERMVLSAFDLSVELAPQLLEAAQ